MIKKIDELQKHKILEAAKTWFRDTISTNHANNTKKLVDISNFSINPFLTVYIANFLTGNSKPESIATALLYPRVLGTSITTSFGQNMQSFISVLKDAAATGSITSGMDIEFIDQVDGEKKYCQMKAGPQTINKDDVETIAGHFKSALNLARTNGIKVTRDNFIVGVIYGTPDELNSHYKRITKDYDYEVIVGEEFWYRLTGDKSFYYELIQAVGTVATEADYSEELKSIISILSKEDLVIKLGNLNNHE